MSKIDGGLKCIYHYIDAVALGLLTYMIYFGVYSIS